LFQLSPNAPVFPKEVECVRDRHHRPECEVNTMWQWPGAAGDFDQFGKEVEVVVLLRKAQERRGIDERNVQYQATFIVRLDRCGFTLTR
jgi:hypothetical protein